LFCKYSDTLILERHASCKGTRSKEVDILQTPYSINYIKEVYNQIIEYVDMLITHNTTEYKSNQIYNQTIITAKHDGRQCIFLLLI
jgi:hypothetical protein